MLRELTEYSNNNNNKKFPRRNESYTSEINKNLQATHSGENEAGIQINYLEHKEEINIQPESKKKKELKNKTKP